MYTPLVALTYDVHELDAYPLWPDQFRGLTAAGMAALAVQTTLPTLPAELVIDAVDGLIIGGGADLDPARYGGDVDDPLVQHTNPVRDEHELELLRLARLAGKPVLAICRGIQLVNVACGGTVVADIKRDWPDAVEHYGTDEGLARPLHPATVEPGTRLSRWMGTAGPVDVNSQHHQAVGRVGDGVLVSARSDDGLVEGIELAGEPVVGVQWHPEVLWREADHAMNLLRAFTAECRYRAVPSEATPTPVRHYADG